MTGGCVMHVDTDPCQPILLLRRWGALQKSSGPAEMSFIIVTSFRKTKLLKLLTRQSFPLSSVALISSCVIDVEIPAFRLKHTVVTLS